MEFDDLPQSGIRRIANYSPYLDQLAGFANEMGLQQRSNLVHLERCLLTKKGAKDDEPH
jgi:hypothetical protein